MNGYFEQNLTKQGLVRLFGSRLGGRGMMYKDIPTLPDFVRGTLNNIDIKFPKDCNIIGLTMPFGLVDNQEFKDQYYLGRLNMQCYFNNETSKAEGNNTLYYTVNVGHDIPYYVEKPKDKNGYIKIPDGFFSKNDKGEIEIKFNPVLNGSASGNPSNLTMEIAENGLKNFYEWLRDIEHDSSGKPVFKYEQVTDKENHTNAGIDEYFPIPAQNSNDFRNWTQYQGYGYNYKESEDGDQVLSPLYSIGYDKPGRLAIHDEYGRNSSSIWLKNSQNIHYCPNQSASSHGSSTAPRTKPWMEAQLFYIPFNGHLFMLSNQFPETYVNKTSNNPWYAQFTRPVCFNTPDNNGLCQTVPFGFGDRFDHITTNKYYKIGESVQSPKVAVSFNDGTEVGVIGQLWGMGDNPKELPRNNGARRTSTFNLMTKLPPVYQSYTGNLYNKWLKAPENYPNMVYLDGSVVFKTSADKDAPSQTIVQNGDYELVYTPSGALAIKNGGQYRSYLDNVLKEKMIFPDKLMLVNGDLVFMTTDGKAYPLLEILYTKNGHKDDWVNLPNARLELTADGRVEVTSSSRVFALNQKGLKPGLNGMLYNSSWGVEKWPSRAGKHTWLSKKINEEGAWIGDNYGSDVGDNSNTTFRGTLEGCRREWW